MSMAGFGIGALANHVPGYGDADSWGGPLDGVDFMQHLGQDTTDTKGQKNADYAMFVTILAVLGLLWVLAFVFRKVRI